MSEGWSYFLDFKDQSFELGQGELTVGRSRACDVAIDDPSVSRKHVILETATGAVRLRDLGSSNGTFINGTRVADVGELHHGDTLGLGDADVKVRVVGTSAFETVRMSAVTTPEHGDATLFLQEASAKLAQEAMEVDPAAAPAGPAHLAPPPVQPAAPSHMAPPPASHMTPPAPAPHMAPPPLQPQSPPAAAPPAAAPPAAAPPAAAPTPAAAPRAAVPPATASPAAAPPAAAPPAAPSAEPSPADPAAAQAATPFQAPPASVPSPSAAAPPPPAPMPPVEAEPLVMDAPVQPLTPPSSAGESPFAPQAPAAPRPAPPSAAPTPPAPPLAASSSPVAASPPGAASPVVPPPMASPEPAAPVPLTPTSADGGVAGASQTGVAGAPQTGVAGAPQTGVAGAPQTDVRMDQTAGDLLPSLDGFDITMGPEMLKAVAVEAREESEEPTEAVPNPYSNPYGPPAPQQTAAGFGIRLLAALLDGIWITAAGAGAWFLLPQPIGGAVSSGLSFVVYLFGWAIWGTTPGKRACQLHVTAGAGGQAGLGFPKAFLRLIGYLVSSVTLGIGFLMIAFNAKHRGLHDLIAGTEVHRQG
ncbi:MAG: FHA domain-containing protein [Acidobacteriota bacterium]